jgi:RNA polymerase sigma factor (sigma-70 family)
MVEQFPATRHSAIEAGRSVDEATRRLGYERVAKAYWRPVLAYLRLRHRLPPADAEDVTQQILEQLWSRQLLAQFQPHRVRFRTYLRSCIDNLVANRRRDAAAAKRGGGWVAIEEDISQLERALDAEEVPSDPDPETLFEREWTRMVFEEAMRALREDYVTRGRTLDIQIFEEYELDGRDQLTYLDLAARHRLTTSAVTNRLASVRRDLRLKVLTTLASLTATDEEYRAEAERILGRRP